ncbi:DivIVA domain-containing protein [Embleya hyalina]|uniref:DivIVA domain-containing protein n=1 Tax=Embleya hyalina TaxID=516124 RepID=A0A401Z3Q2_9ACTN|nr:DivIVA domain-containing protein [Embleya hyalina]GCE01474.1 DivIVA domain-containing protein [Embleya hyalina]
MFWIQLVVVIGVVLVIAAVVLGAGGSLPDAYREQPELRMPGDRPLTSADVDHIRFPVVFRGYRMSEVDLVLDRLTGELAARDARILELEYKVAGTTPVGVASAMAGVGAAGASAFGASGHAPSPRGSGTTLSLEKPERAEAAGSTPVDAESAEPRVEPAVDADETPASNADESAGEPAPEAAVDEAKDEPKDGAASEGDAASEDGEASRGGAASEGDEAKGDPKS